MRNLYRTWKGLPEIVRFGLGLALVIMIMLVLPAEAKADTVYEDEAGDRIRVTEKHCPPEIAVRAAQGQRGYYLAAEVRLGAITYRACATLVTVHGRPDAQVHILYEDGDQGLMPLADLRRVPGV